MNSVERTVIAATRAYGETVREIRPLNLALRQAERPAARPRRAPRRKTWMTPLIAAAAVVGLAISLVVVRDLPNGRVVPPVRSAVAAIPRFYVALNDPSNLKAPDPVVIGDMTTGKRLAVLRPPAHSTFAGVTGAVSDRTFVLDVTQFPWSDTYSRVQPRSWYLLRIAPGTAHPAQMTRLPIPPTPSGAAVDGIALSPDGREFAVMFQPKMMGPAPGPVTLRIFSVATGELLHAWTGPTPNPNSLGVLTFGADLYVDNNTTLSWTDGGNSLAFIYGPEIVNDTTVRLLDPSSPGHALLTDSRVILDLKSGSQPRCTSLLLTADGQRIECGATALAPRNTDKCADTGALQRPGFYEYSAVNGKLARVVYQYTGTCFSAIADVLWASPSGATLIGGLGVRRNVHTFKPSYEDVALSQGTFSPLSFPLASVPIPGGIAW